MYPYCILYSSRISASNMRPGAGGGRGGDVLLYLEFSDGYESVSIPTLRRAAL